MNSTECINRFLDGRCASAGNLRSTGRELTLFHNIIAILGPYGLEVTNAGWWSTTTVRKLNQLPGVIVRHRSGRGSINGVPWDGSMCNLAQLAVKSAEIAKQKREVQNEKVMARVTAEIPAIDLADRGTEKAGTCTIEM